MSASPAARPLVDLLAQRLGSNPSGWFCPNCNGDLIVLAEGRVRCPVGCGHTAIETALLAPRTTERPRDVGKTFGGGVPFDAPVLPGARSVDRWAAREQDVARVLPRLGEARLNEPFSCSLPGHTTCRARLRFDSQSGTWRYRCGSWAGDPTAWWSLAEVRASIAYRAPRRLSRAEQWMWFGRLGYEGGVVEPVRVLLPRLPAHANPTLHPLRDGLALAFGIRWLTEPGRPAPFTSAFAAAWCSVGQEAAKKGLRRLRELEIAHAEVLPKAGPRRFLLWTPGRGGEHRAR